jgi:anti-sigma regulatory factor (Ser/Thr protein kinase)
MNREQRRASGDPVAFLSYAHHDDRRGHLTRLREFLMEELQSQTGEAFEIFMDSDDIGLGEDWRRRLDEGLAAATFLIPILTPSFLKSQYCRDELRIFSDHERTLGRDDLILPIYYVDCSHVRKETDSDAADALDFLVERQYFDWRELRELPFSNTRVKRELQDLAGEIRAARERASSERMSPGAPRRVATTGTQEWIDSLRSGSLDVELDARSPSDMYSLVSVVGDALSEEAFTRPTVDRAAVILIELITNVARHAPESRVRVEVRIQSQRFRSVSMTVLDAGPGFDLSDVLDEHHRRLAEGDREHGLLRALRLAGDLSYVHRSGSDTPQGVCAEVYETDSPQSIFYEYDFVAPVRMEYEWPKVFWIGETPYFGSTFIWTLVAAMKQASQRLLELYFAPIETAKTTHLGLEVTGGKVATEIPPYAFETLSSALELHFDRYFKDRRVVVLTHDTDFFVSRKVAEWAASREIAYFDDELACRKRLNETAGTK